MDKPRETAVRILGRVEEGAFADALLDQARKQFPARDRAFILELVYGVLRQRSRLDFILDQFSAQPLSRTDAWTRNILRMAAYQILFLNKVPASAAVNTATELAKQYGRKSGYVNGLLRSLERKRNSIAEPAGRDAVSRLCILHSHPAWLVKRWVERYGAERAEILLRENNNPSRLVVRTNTARTNRKELKASLSAQGAETRETSFSEEGLEILSSPPLRTLEAYEKGWFMVQDEAAQLISRLLAPVSGDTVLDACAAPGGKATHLAALMENEGRVLALESDPGRMTRVLENRDRLGATIITPVLGDAAAFQEGSFNKVLIDAPCSGLGVLRRHPDGRWNKREETIRERSGLQREILRNCATLVKPGGVLVYATCTTEREENEEIISAFLEQAAGTFSIDDPRPFLPEPARKFVGNEGFFRTFPGEPALDGFFGARLIRK